MLSDRVAVDMTGTEPVLRIGEATHAWIMGEGRSIAEKALAGDWLKGRVQLKSEHTKSRFYTTKNRRKKLWH